MFSKRDYIQYFEQVACLERKMIYRVTDMLGVVEDPYVCGVLKGLGADAMRRYSLLSDLLQSKSFSESAADKRLVNRRSALGKVRLIFKERGLFKELSAYCVNFSHQGLCFESEHRVEAGARFEVRISLFDQCEPIRSVGKVVWVKEALPGFYLAGMQFES
ncbi:MAG TPA: PilZ domain-containing protein [Candidatus Omnitrophota bacterium]|nr:PilZ domain-containing protein [Candidatus Omnitrophota bacterium]HPS36896.1 PilZ domain-containing protein [Candidatus Omnitrophota bacterium]